MTIESSQGDSVRPTWQEYWAGVGNEEWLAAKALLELEEHGGVRREVETWLAYDSAGDWYDEDGGWRSDPVLDWWAWVADVDARGRAWSGSEARLYQLVAGLTTGRPFNIVGVLDEMGSSQVEVLAVLVDWASGGNNHEHAGLARVVQS